MDVEKVIKGLECCTKKLCIYKDTEKECPYSELCGDYEEAFEDCTTALSKDALALLKAQEPRVMTLEDAINSEMVWAECTNGDGGYGTCRLVEIYGMVAAEVFMLKNKYPKRNLLNPGKYLREWRCWTSCPTKEQMEETPWND